MNSAIVCSGPLAQIKREQIWQHIHFSMLIADTEWPALFHQASPTVPAVCPRTVSPDKPLLSRCCLQVYGPSNK